MAALSRPAFALLGASFAMSALVACAGTIEGRGEFEAGSAPETTTTAPTTTETTTETTETTTETTTTAPTTEGLTLEEQAACLSIPLSDIDAFIAFNDLADMPEENQTTEARMAVADEFSAAIDEVDGLIAPLPEGEVKQASVAYRAAQVEVRDNLNAGDPVSTGIILDANDVLDDVCGNG